MEKTVKCLLLKVDNVIVTEIIEVGSELGEPDCKLINSLARCNRSKRNDDSF